MCTLVDLRYFTVLVFFFNMNVVTKGTIYYYIKFVCVVLWDVEGGLFSNCLTVKHTHFH